MTPFDVANLNNAMAGVGNAFAERRQEGMQQQRLNMESDLRQKMLDTEMRRLALEQGRQNTLAGGQVDTWLQGEDGGTVHFQGPQAGLDQLMSQSEAKGKPLSVLDQPPNAKPQYGVWETDTPLGRIQVHLNSPDDLQKVADQVKKVGGGPIGRAPTYGPIAADSAAADLENQADQLEKQMSTGPGQWDPTIQAQVERLRSRAQFLRQPKYDPTQFETQTTHVDPNTGQPVVSTTRKVPVGATGLPTGAADDTGAAAVPTAATATGPVRVSTKAQRDALPIGTRYLGPDGKAYIKQ